jgi:FkbM family methyltransferase
LFFDLARSARIVLDIGAHVGYFALLAAHANRDGKVYAFEPLPRVYERLQRNVALNKVPNLTCLPLAVGAESGVAEFFHVSRGIPSTSSLSREFMEEIYDLQLEQQKALHSRLTSCQVDVVTIDEFLTEDENRMVDLVKLDTETTEDAALRGMAHTIEQSRPVIVCEILKDRAANLIEDLLRPLGYQYFLLTASGPAARARITPEFPWFNHVFSPEERSPLDLRMAPSP